MFIPAAVARQHAAAATLLARFIAGDPEAAALLVRQLGADDHAGSEPLREVISSCADLLLWQRLLRYLALPSWGDDADGRNRLSGDALIRTRAAIVNLFLGTDDSPAVIQIKSAALLEGSTALEPNVRHIAATLLGLQGDSRAISMLIEAASTGERFCQLQAIEALGQLKHERGGIALAEALSSDDEEIHWAASRALNTLKEAAFITWLQLLKAPKPHVRWHAACGLRDIGNARAANNLAEAVFDDDFSVRWAAAEALAMLGAPAVPEILQRIAQGVLAEDACQAAYHVLQQLAPCIGHNRLQPLLEALRHRNAPNEAPLRAAELLKSWESKR